MPTIREEPMMGHAHCPDPQCDPYQHETPVIRRTVEYSFVDSGGDFPGLERSSVSIVAGDDTAGSCPQCGRVRELSVGERPEYPNESGVDPRGLLGISPQSSDPGLVAMQTAANQDAKIEELQQQIAKLAAAAPVPAALPTAAPAAEADPYQFLSRAE